MSRDVLGLFSYVGSDDDDDEGFQQQSTSTGRYLKYNVLIKFFKHKLTTSILGKFHSCGLLYLNSSSTCPHLYMLQLNSLKA